MWETFAEMKRLQKEMNELLSYFWETQGQGQPAPREPFLRKPLLDLKEREKELVAIIELPGVDKREIRLDIKEDRLEVKVESRKEIEAVKEDHHLKERVHKGFYRAVQLPHPVVPEQCRATFRDGILEIVMPKGLMKEKKPILIEG